MVTVMIAMATKNIPPSVLPPIMTTGDWIPSFPPEVERSLVGVALVKLVFVAMVTNMLSSTWGSMMTVEVGVAWGVVGSEVECSFGDEEGSGRSIRGEVLGESVEV